MSARLSDGSNMLNETGKRFAVGALQLAVTLALTALLLYLALVVRMNSKWITLLIMTAGIFGLAIYETRDKWQDWRYWVTVLACLIVHFALIVAGQKYLAGLPTAILGVFGTLESGGIFWILLTVCE